MVALLYILLSFTSAFGANPCQNSIQCSIQSILVPYESNNSLSGTLLIRKRGFESSWSIGLANDVIQQPNTVDTVYLIASDSKSFVAASILKLMQNGKLRLTDNIGSYIPEYPRRNLRRAGKEVTVFNLLTHTSGLSEAYDVASIESKVDRVQVTFTDMMDAIKHKPLRFTPGSRYEYLNTGYLILGEIVRRLTGDTYSNFLKSNFFSTIPLRETSVGPSTSVPDLMARSYVGRGVGRRDFQIMNGLGSLAAEDLFADTNIYTSAPDLATWADGVTSGQILSPDSTKQMLTPYLNEYGFGWIIFRDVQGHLAYEHAGDFDGYQSWVRRYPNDATTIVWLSNQAQPDDQLSAFIEAVCSAALNSQM